MEAFWRFVKHTSQGAAETCSAFRYVTRNVLREFRFRQTVEKIRRS
ncbi:hypothetical protein M7I_0529 [Glarea lozoyensis 74030]|uniref:Uncharacterized protein n=1 Tax=Glarea lozoyensis (strain ATCC 74030 / MF5533) TaxID=1104152 RepID=H0EDS3_GLAL7|nr:hypothetical protein M7I_0529 [Glarea lozoyensis 74030]